MKTIPVYVAGQQNRSADQAEKKIVSEHFNWEGVIPFQLKINLLTNYTIHISIRGLIIKSSVSKFNVN